MLCALSALAAEPGGPDGLGKEDGARLLERCESCEACSRACPTGAIDRDGLVLRGERCLTLHNESAADLPAWVEPSWHHCLFGCLRCQERCPENARVARRVEERGEFTEEETEQLLRRVEAGRLSAPLAAKLERLGLSFDPARIGRNLAALLAARKGAAA